MATFTPGRLRRIEQEQVHRPVVEHLRTRGVPGLLWWHTPQGAFYATRVQGSIMTGLGVMPGVSDLILMHAGRFFALELKAPGQKPTQVQMDFLVAFVKAGGHAEYADNLDSALDALDDWGLVRGKRQ